MDSRLPDRSRSCDTGVVFNTTPRNLLSHIRTGRTISAGRRMTALVRHATFLSVPVDTSWDSWTNSSRSLAGRTPTPPFVSRRSVSSTIPVNLGDWPNPIQTRASAGAAVARVTALDVLGRIAANDADDETTGSCGRSAARHGIPERPGRIGRRPGIRCRGHRACRRPSTERSTAAVDHCQERCAGRRPRRRARADHRGACAQQHRPPGQARVHGRCGAGSAFRPGRARRGRAPCRACRRRGGRLRSAGRRLGAGSRRAPIDRSRHSTEGRRPRGAAR